VTRDEAIEGIMALLEELGREGAIPAPCVALETARLEDLGLDSIARLTVIQACESRFSVDIPLGALEGVSSIGDLADVVVSVS
jgi:hypothetical protein